jgi:glutathione peroxidase
VDLYGIPVTAIDGATFTMDRYRGHTLLIVNVASACGFTPQYAGLEALYRKYKDAGFFVLGFPCDQFGRQEPGTHAEIRQFCAQTYDVTFPLFSKIEVNGPNAHPLYRFLKARKKGILGSASIKWNFSKFLVSGSGEVLKRYGSRDTPQAIDSDVRALVAVKER